MMDRNDHMDRYEQDKVETAITLGLAAVKEQLKRLEDQTARTLDSLEDKIGSIVTRINDGFTERMIILEQQVKGLQSVKAWMAGLLGALIVAMVLGFISNYTTLQTKTQTIEQQLKYLGDQLSQRRQSGRGTIGEP